MPAIRDERGSFERQVVALLPALFGTALRLTRDRADAEDLVADAVAKAWRCRESLRDPAALRGWMFRILTNAFVSGRRKATTRGVHEPFEETGEREEGFSLFARLHQPFLLWWGNPEQEFLNRLLREDLERAIDALPEPYRVAVVLADVQGLSYSEIGEALGVPVGTVRSRLARGRSALQRALWEHGRDAGLAGLGKRGNAP